MKVLNLILNNVYIYIYIYICILKEYVYVYIIYRLMILNNVICIEIKLSWRP